jgi:hypothetical protein
MLSSVFWLLVLLVAIAALWLLASVTVNAAVGLRRRLRVDTGPVVRTSPWGDADVNGVGFTESVRLVECANGWLVQLHWLLGSGKIWLPRGETRLDGPGELGESFVVSRVLSAGPHRIKLERELAEFVARK